MNLNTAPERRPQTLKERRAQLLRWSDMMVDLEESGELEETE